MLCVTGEAMSVPVVGTIMGLCIVYILPGSEGSWMPVPLTDFQRAPPPPAGRVGLSLSPGPVAKGRGMELVARAEAEATHKKAHHLEVEEDHAVRLKVSLGLAGIRITPENPEPFHCEYCTGLFKFEDPVYEWKNKKGELVVLHERCILSFSEELEANDSTLRRVQELAENTRSMWCLGSLFNCEDDLVRLNVWPLDSPTSSPEAKSHSSESENFNEAERPCKARRTLDLDLPAS